MPHSKLDKPNKPLRTASRHTRRRTSSDEDEESEGDLTERPASPPRHRQFLRTYASSSSLPRTAVDALPAHRTSSSPTRTTTKTFLVQPVRRRSSSSENLSPAYRATPPSFPPFPSNGYRDSDDEQRVSASNGKRKSVPNDTACVGVSNGLYAPRPHGAHHAQSASTGSIRLFPEQPPPPYIDPADSNDAIYTVSRRRSAKGKSRTSSGDETPDNAIPGPSTLPSDRAAQAGIATRLVRFSLRWRGDAPTNAKGKAKEDASNNDDAPAQYPIIPTPPRPIHTQEIRLRRTSVSGEDTETPQPLSPLGPSYQDHDRDVAEPFTDSEQDDPMLKFTIDLNFNKLRKLLPFSLSFLFQFSRFLSVVPAFFGLLFCIYQMFHFEREDFLHEHWVCRMPGVDGVEVSYGAAKALEGYRCRGPPVPDTADWLVASLWALLTAYHCLGLSTGLLMRWKLYYPPLATLVRLLGLQGICWPATNLTLSIVGGVRRPVVAWALIGTTTAVSRSIQIWVTSNIIWVNGATASSTFSGDESHHHHHHHHHKDAAGATTTPAPPHTPSFFNKIASIIGGDDDDSAPVGQPYNLSAAGPSQAFRRRERRWDWRKVGMRCLLPTGFLYVVMAWVAVGRREWESQYA